MKVTVITLALLLSTTVAFAQKVTGSVDGTGSYNFRKSHNENLNFSLNYDSPKWFLHSKIDGGYGYNPTDVIKISTNWDNEVEDRPFTAANTEVKQTFQKRWNTGVALQSGINISPVNKLRMNLSAKYRGNNDTPDMCNSAFSETKELCGRQLDSISFESGSVNYGVEFRHNFRSAERVLVARVTGDLIFDIDVKDRQLFNIEGQYYKKEKRYRAPSSLNDLNFKYQFGYSDKELFNVKGMEAFLGVEVIQNNDVDLLRRENYVNGQWRDSAAMRQDYYYSSIAPEPFVELQYSIGKIDVRVKERAQIYRHGLMMDRKGTSGQNLPDSVAFDKWDPRNFFAGGIVYRFRPRHKLAVDYDHSVSRPDYQKLTDMVKIGDSEGEYFVGNHDLTPQINNKISLRYTYTFKKTYEFYFDLQYRHIRDKAEKVVKETKDDGIKYFTYINADKQETGSFRFDLKGAWTRFKAEMYLQANYDFFYKKDAEKAHKTNFSWEAYADLSYAFDKGWKVSAKGGYASRQVSAYNAKDRYISTNVKVSKLFLNCLDVYVEGRDLADRDLYEYTWNEKMDYCKVSMTSSYRRAFVLGLKYIF